MPDFDAGTARAHIRVDGDSRGAEGATRAVEGFQRALEFIAGRLGGFVAAMDKIEGELNNVQGDFKNAADAADKYDRAIDGVTIAHVKASRSTNDLSKNIQELHGRLRFAHDAWADIGIPIVQATRAVQEFNRSGGGITGVVAAISRVGVASAAMAAVKSHFIGMGLALRQAPVWQQNLARLAQNIGLVTLAGSRIGVVTNVLTRSFANIVRGAEGADFAMAGLAHTLNKIPLIRGFAEPIVRGFGKILDGAEGAETSIAGFERTLRRATDPVGNFFGALDKVPNGLFKMVGGLAVARSGIQGLQQRFALLNTVIGQGGGRIGQALRFILLPGVIASSAAIQALDGSLRFISNTIAGLWSGIKQLAGGFLALPGAIAMVGAAAGPMAVIVKTISSNFKDLIKAVGDNDVEKFAEAMQKIPPYLRPLAQAVANAIGPLKSLGDVLTATFVSGGLDQQFTALVNTWLPAISTGADQVANSWKILTNGVASFLGEAQTISGVNTIFMHTSQTMNAVASSIQPLLEGLRDIAVVGSGFIRNLAEDYLPGIAEKFRAWASNAAGTGRAMAWMEGSVHAVKELYIGADQAVRLVWRLLTLFQTKSGDTFLDRFANEMTKLNNEVQNSAASGELRKISDAVKSMGTDKLRELKEIFKDALPSIKEFLQVFNNIAAGFQHSPLLSVIEGLIYTLGQFASVLNSLGITPAIGFVLGMYKAFGLLSVAASTAWDAVKVFLGLSFFKAGAETAILGLATSLEKLGPMGVKASNGVLKVGDSLAGFVQKATIIGAIGLGVWEVFNTGADQMKASSQAISDATKRSQEGLVELRKAFYTDQGKTGPTVIGQLAKNAQQDMDSLQNISEKAPGLSSHIKDSISHTFDWSNISRRILPNFGGSDELRDLSNKADSAKTTLNATNDALTKLGGSSQDLSKYIYGSNDAFLRFTDQLSRAGQSGAVEYWGRLRTQFTELQNEMEAAGPGAIQLASGIDKIASSGGNAASKLDGLKLSLQGLGLLKEDQYEAALNFAKAIDNLGDAAANAADKSQPLQNLLDPTTGILNTAAGVNANNLYNSIQPIAEAFLKAAASGQDLTAFIPRMNDNLEKLRQSFGLSKDAFDKFIQGLGIDPPIVSLLVQAKDDGVEKGLIEIAARARTSIGNQAPIELPVGVDAPAVSKQINDLFNNPNAVGVHGQNIVLQPGIDQAAIDRISQYLAQKYGIHLPGGQPIDPAVAATMPVVPTTPGPAPVIPTPGTPPQPKGQGPAPATPPAPPVPNLPPGMPMPALPPTPATAGAGLGKPQTALPPGTYLPPGMGPPAPLDVPPPPPAPAPAPVPAPAAAPAAPPPMKINVDTSALDAANGQIENFKNHIVDAFKAATDAVDNFNKGMAAEVAAIMGAVDNLATGIKQKFDALGSGMHDSGAKMIHDFAEGIRSAADEVQRATTDAAHVVAEVLVHRSPPRSGPLSGSGWLGFSGRKAIQDLADGMKAGLDSVLGVSNIIAGAMQFGGGARGDTVPGVPNLDPNRALPTGPGAITDLPGAQDLPGGGISIPAGNTRDSGTQFSQGFADGITDPDALRRIADAAALAAKTAADYMPHSPAVKGPLSGAGWSGHAGSALSGDFARGIEGGVSQVGDAANKLAGKVAGALKPKTPYGTFGFTEKEEPFKDLKAILKVASDGMNLVKSVSDQIFKVVDFAQDPFGTKKNQDTTGAGGTGTGASRGATTIGNILNQGASALAGNANPSQQDIASAIAGEAQRRGYDRNTAIAVLAAGMHESNLNPNVTNASGHQSLFQTSADKGVGLNAGDQIKWMFNQLDALGGPGAAKNDPLDFIASQIEKGGYTGAALGTHAQAAANLYDKALQTGATVGQGAFALPGGGALTANPASMASRIPNAPNVEAGIRAIGGVAPLYQPGSTQVPQWMQQLAQQFGLTASTYPGGGSLHQMGFAADFNSPTQNKADLERFAQYISGNLASQTMQLIFQGAGGNQYGIASGKTAPPGYYAGDFGQHTDHVHWATDVAPILAGANANAMPWAAGNSPAQQSAYGQTNPITGMPGQVGQPGQPGQTTQDQLKTAGAVPTDPNALKTAGTAPDQTQTFGATDGQVQNQSQQIQSAMGSASNIASSIMQTMQAGLDAWGATKYILDQMVRGVSDTEDIYNLIDQFQKYITFAADVASSVGQVLSAVGSMTGGADMGGTAAAGQAAQMISALLTTINSAIDMGQEAYRIFGSYFGQFLGYLAGGPAGMMGDVHFLLDQNTGQLLAYSGDNPLNKTAHALPGSVVTPNANNQTIGQLNYYAGPGQDPRDSTRQMMYQVRASQLTAVTAQ